MMGTAVYSIRLVVRTYIIPTRHNRFCWFVFNSSNVFHRYLEKIRQTADIQARLGTIIRWVRNVEENALHALQLRTRLIYFRIIFRQLRFITHYSSLLSGFSSRTRSRFVGFILMSEAPCVCTRSRPEKTCAEDFVCTHCIETSYVITLPPPLCARNRFPYAIDMGGIAVYSHMTTYDVRIVQTVWPHINILLRIVRNGSTGIFTGRRH